MQIREKEKDRQSSKINEGRRSDGAATEGWIMDKLYAFRNCYAKLESSSCSKQEQAKQRHRWGTQHSLNIGS